jgi:hypothetical protein
MKTGAKKVTLTASLTVWDWQADEIKKAAEVMNLGSFQGFLEIAFNNGIAEMLDSAERREAERDAAIDSDDPDDKIPF